MEGQYLQGDDPFHLDAIYYSPTLYTRHNVPVFVAFIGRECSPSSWSSKLLPDKLPSRRAML